MVSTTVMVTLDSGHSYSAEFDILPCGKVRLTHGPRLAAIGRSAWIFDDTDEVRGRLQWAALEISYRHMKGEWPCDE